MHFQVENGTLRELIAKLFAENDSLREQLGSVAAHTNTVSVSSARNSALGWTAEWNNFARQYLFLVAPWLPNAAFGVVARPAIDPISSMRYENEEAKRAAEAAELYDLIPRKYHPIISRADSGFASVVWQLLSPVYLTNEYIYSFGRSSRVHGRTSLQHSSLTLGGSLTCPQQSSIATPRLFARRTPPSSGSFAMRMETTGRSRGFCSQSRKTRSKSSTFFSVSTSSW